MRAQWEKSGRGERATREAEKTTKRLTMFVFFFLKKIILPLLAGNKYVTVFNGCLAVNKLFSVETRARSCKVCTRLLTF